MASTVHLTPAEKRQLEQQELKKRLQAQRLRANRKRGKLAAKTRRLNDAVKVDDPPLPLVDMFGAEQTSLPATIRQTEVPYDKTIPINIEPDPFIEEIVGQPGFKETMVESIKDERIARFLKLIGQVENRSMTWCAKACGLTNSDLAKIWRDSTLTQAFFRIVRRMPDVAEKVVQDALGVQKCCPRCDGLKRIDVPEKFQEFFEKKATAVCPNCEGNGTVSTPGLPHATERIWEKVGWSKKGQQVSVSVNMSDHSVDATIGEMDNILEHQA